MRSGEILLSYQKAKAFAAWEKCLKAYEKEEELTGVIQNKIKAVIFASYWWCNFSFSSTVTFRY